jgi:hypothetical protein
MHGQWSFDEEDAMHVVGHHLNSHHFYLWVIAVYAHPFALHGAAKFRKFYARFVLTSYRSKSITNKMTEERAPPFHL